jgi:hypothetical protein
MSILIHANPLQKINTMPPLAVYNLFSVGIVRRLRISALLSLLLIGVAVFQLGDFDPGHERNHARHCCAACHAGHITAVAGVSPLGLTPPSDAHRHVLVEIAARAADRFILSDCSRAPPA